MIVEVGFYDVDTELKSRSGHKYYVCKHRFNPRNVSLVFVKNDGLSGKKELCKFIKEEVNNG